jgi:hypothetical protein
MPSPLNDLETKLQVLNAYKAVIGKLKGTRTFGRHRCRWEDNIRMDRREIWRVHVNWIHLAQDRDQWWALVNTVMNLKVL